MGWGSDNNYKPTIDPAIEQAVELALKSIGKEKLVDTEKSTKRKGGGGEKMIIRKRFSGPLTNELVLEGLLKAFKITSNEANFWPEYRDTGYPGLSVGFTIIDLRINSKNEYKVFKKALENLRFREEVLKG